MKDNTDILIEQQAETNDLLKALILKETEKADLTGTLKDEQTIIVKGMKGDKGDKGDSPSNEELVYLIKPLIPEPIKGDDGHTPTEEELVAIIEPLIPDPIPGKNGEKPTDAELVSIIEPLIPPPIPGPAGPRGPKGPKGDSASFTTEQLLAMLKKRLSYDDLKDLPNLSRLEAIASKSIEVYDESSKVEGNLESLNFTGSGVTTTSDGHGNLTVVITGGGVGTIYTETPSGAINGVNTSYTVAHTINSVFSLAINGQFIHPTDYSFLGATITMNTALDASLSGSPFTVVYA